MLERALRGLKQLSPERQREWLLSWAAGETTN